MTAVGCAVMDKILEPGFLDGVVSRGLYLQAVLNGLSNRLDLGEVRGRGLLIALDLKRDIAPAVAEKARDAGLLLNAPRPGILRFMPALTVSTDEMDTMVSILEKILKEMKG
jgi:acetylornithine/N-succinyldiaminopimelate aminotransferase